MKFPVRSQFIWFGILAILLAVVGYYVLKGPGPSPPNVLWITMDSLRADRLGCAGYQPAHTPHIDALAREGALFTQSIAQSNYTRISVPSMITGKYPSLVDTKIPLSNLDDFYDTLAEILMASGYATYAILPEWSPGLYQGVERLEIMGGSTVERTQVCLDILNHLDGRPFFLWLYYWDPHAAYQPPEEFAKLFEPTSAAPTSGQPDSETGDERSRGLSRSHAEGIKMVMTLLKINTGKLTPSQTYQKSLSGLYDAEIAFVDSKIKEVVDKFKELDLWDNTMVILNADHGEAFGEHGYYYHGFSIYDEEVRVPLIIKPPQSLASGKVIDGPVRNLDIMPTVLDYCGFPIPKDLNGCSLRPFVEKDLRPNFPTAIETNSPQRNVHLVGYRQEKYKLICGMETACKLYDLQADPGEKENLLSKERSQTVGKIQTSSHKADELRQALLAIYEVDELDDLIVARPEPKIDPLLREQLKAQGYIY